MHLEFGMVKLMTMDVEISSLSIVDGKNMIGMGNSNKGC
jgi:hypothetical protein